MARIAPDPAKPVARPEATAAPLVRKQSARGGLGCYVFAVLCMAQFGLIGGWILSQFYHPSWMGDQSEAHGPDTAKAETDGAEALRPGETPSVERGDELLREGRYDLALKVYEPLAPTASGALRDVVQYRVGLCQEGLGRTDQALKAYSVVAGRTENPRAKAAAEVGQARVLVRLRKPAEARAFLYPVLLRAGTPELKDQPCVADARYLLALTLTLDALRPEKPGPLSDALADYTAADWPAEAALSWVGAAAEAAPPKPEKPEKPEKTSSTAQPAAETNYVGVERTGPNAIRVTASVSEGTTAHLIERLAERARLKVQWTEAARKAIGDRAAALAIQDLPVGDVLIDLILPLTDPLGLVATIKGDTLHLATPTETSDEALTAYRNATAKRALSHAITSNPVHRLTPAANLALGNLDARAGNVKEAASRYERIGREFRSSPLTIEASYNLGLTRLKLGQTGEARTAFYAAHDHAPGHELAPLALLQVGRTFLLEGDPEQAIQPLKAALAASGGTPTEPATAVTLAAAYLLADRIQPDKASRVIREHPEPLRQPPYRATALFLDAYSQFLMVKGKESARQAGELLAALWGVEQKGPVLGPVGPLVIGHAYRDLDQPADMIALYQKALPNTQGPLAAEMSFALAEDFYRHDQRAAARKLYLPLAKAEGDRWSAASQLKLAEIALLDNQPQEALQACRKLLQDKQPVKRETVLLLMGQAYERAGEYLKAASCFKGQLPE